MNKKQFKIQYPASLALELPKDDNRQKDWKKQRKEKGYDNTEIWNLDSTFAELMLPRVKDYYEWAGRVFVKDEEWAEAMKAIIEAFEIMLDDQQNHIADKKTNKKINKGIRLFSKYIRGMGI